MTQMDRLYEAVAAKGPVCVGLDTDFSYLPEGYADRAATKCRLPIMRHSAWTA